MPILFLGPSTMVPSPRTRTLPSSNAIILRVLAPEPPSATLDRLRTAPVFPHPRTSSERAADAKAQHSQVHPGAGGGGSDRDARVAAGAAQVPRFSQPARVVDQAECRWSSLGRSTFA